MAKTTVSKEIAREFPELAHLEGQTVDASVVQRATAKSRTVSIEGKRSAAVRVENSTPKAPANIVDRNSARTLAPKKRASKKTK